MRCSRDFPDVRLAQDVHTMDQVGRYPLAHSPLLSSNVPMYTRPSAYTFVFPYRSVRLSTRVLPYSKVTATWTYARTGTAVYGSVHTPKARGAGTMVNVDTSAADDRTRVPSVGADLSAA